MGLLKTTSFSFLTKLPRTILGISAATLMFSFPILSNAEDENTTINLRDVEIPVLIETVSRITGKSFIIDPRVKGRVTVITSSGVGPDELYETFLAVLQVHGFSAVPSFGNLIKVVPSNKAKQQPVPVIGEEEESFNISTKKGSKKRRIKRKADELITRVIRVEHVPAAMLVPILRPLVPSTGQLQAYGPSNTIVISDTAGNIDRLIKVIRRMDRADDEELEVIPLKYASAKDLARTIQTLQKSSIKGAASKNKVAADDRTNSLLLSGDKSSRQQVRKIIAKLDTPQPLEEKTKVYYLKYAKAEDLSKVLTGFSKTQKATKATTKGAAGTQKADIDIQADESSNSLIITAEPDVQRNLAKVIRQLDVRRAQVLVEAIIAEVSADVSKTLGTSLGFSSTRGLLGGAGTVSGVNALLTLLASGDGTNAQQTAALAGVAPPSGGGRLGLVDNIGNNKFGLLIDALSGDGATNILSTPTIVALDNEEASIVIGENVPFVTGSSTTNSAGLSNPFQTIERRDIGITLKIKPQINDGSSVRLDIEQEVSSLGAAASTAAERITNKRSITTSVMVEDGQVLVLGGLMRDSFTDQETKTPFLGDVPIIGKLFRSTTTQKTKTNLMVFIHPVIMRDVLSGDFYTRQKYSKLKHAQDISKVTSRGILKDNAAKFSDNIRSNLTEKLTPEQKKLIIKREQEQRVLAYNRRIADENLAQQQRVRMQQQRKAAIMHKRRAGANSAVSKATNTRAKLPQRLQNIVPRKRTAPVQK